MSKLNENWQYEKNDIIADYDDNVCRRYGITSAPDILGFELEVNPESDGKGIDLRAKHDHDIGVEVERGHWAGDFWTNYYSTLAEDELGFQTVNMPYRKEKYYLPEYHVGKGSNKTLVDNRKKMDKVIFERWNWDGSQVIIVHADVVRNPDKLFRSGFKPNNGSKKEKWLSFKREDVITLNKQENGKFLPETDPNGKYVTLSPEELNRQNAEIAKHKAELRAKKADEKLKRAAEVYRESKKKK